MTENATEDKAPSNGLYEIIMVAIAGSIVLMCAVYLALVIMRKRWDVCNFLNNGYTEDAAVSTTSLYRSSEDTNISTIDLKGPVHITYISEKDKPVPEIPISRVKLSREALLYISLITCMNLPDNIESEETL